MIKIILGISVIVMIFTLGYSQNVFAQEVGDEMTIEEEAMVEETMEDEIPLLGSDRDEFGCISSAGYSWSEEKQECVRPWEVIETPPLRFQIEFRDPSEEITCRNNLVKMYKNSGELICVKETSVQKLTERNFASEDKPPIVPLRMGAGTNGGICQGKPNKSWQGAAYGYCLTMEQRDQLKGMFGQCLAEHGIEFTFKILESLIKGGVGFIGPLLDCGKQAQAQMGLVH